MSGIQPSPGISQDTVETLIEEASGTDTNLGAVAAKNPPIDADKALYRDSASDDAIVTSTWAQVKAFLKTYFDGIYADAGANTDITSLALADGLVARPEIKDYSETKTAPESATNVLTLDIVNGNVFSTLLDENVTTLNFDNPSPTGKACSFTWIMTQHSTAVTVAWPASVKWSGGTAPDITADDGIYVFTFLTVDAGTSWLGFAAGSNMAVPA